MSVRQLEQEMITYLNLLSVPVLKNNEPLKEKGEDILYGYQPSMSDMANLFGGKIFLRSTVLDKLRKAQENLTKLDSNLTLFVTYGYRSLRVQTEKFLQQLRQISETTFFSNPVDLYEETHRFIAVPTVAGHTTGGAVDVTIINSKTNQFLDFGSNQYDFSNKDCYTFALKITKQAKRNRLLLRSCMAEVEFAPYDGEWWHFSYGDREWAYYYKRQNAIYDQLPEGKVKDLVI